MQESQTNPSTFWDRTTAVPCLGQSSSSLLSNTVFVLSVCTRLVKAMLANTHIFLPPPCLVFKPPWQSICCLLGACTSPIQPCWDHCMSQDIQWWHSNSKYPSNSYDDCSTSNNNLLNLCLWTTHQLRLINESYWLHFMESAGALQGPKRSLPSWPRKCRGQCVIVFISGLGVITEMCMTSLHQAAPRAAAKWVTDANRAQCSCLNWLFSFSWAWKALTPVHFTSTCQMSCDEHI